MFAAKPNELLTAGETLNVSSSSVTGHYRTSIGRLRVDESEHALVATIP